MKLGFSTWAMPKIPIDTSLKFLSIEGLYKSMGFENRNSNYPQFTDHCFTGEYPVEPVDAKENKFEEKQISYLSSKN